ncbi:seed maturation protein [Wolffia australiana]
MAQNKEDVKFGVAQAKLSEDESLRVAYKHGTPLEAGKIAESSPVSLFSAAERGISPPEQSSSPRPSSQQEEQASDEQSRRPPPV